MKCSTDVHKMNLDWWRYLSKKIKVRPGQAPVWIHCGPTTFIFIKQSHIMHLHIEKECIFAIDYVKLRNGISNPIQVWMVYLLFGFNLNLSYTLFSWMWVFLPSIELIRQQSKNDPSTLSLHCFFIIKKFTFRILYINERR